MLAWGGFVTCIDIKLFCDFAPSYGWHFTRFKANYSMETAAYRHHSVWKWLKCFSAKTVMEIQLVATLRWWSCLISETFVSLVTTSKFVWHKIERWNHVISHRSKPGGFKRIEQQCFTWRQGKHFPYGMKKQYCARQRERRQERIKGFEIVSKKSVIL